ncbi:glycosyltransferase [Agromyces sp. NPDC058484]|uniref:glycosyltransferase n=1 Tax=Agromyces sp. NPDC058484 TaxID=3346524 RepID=UPI003668EB87
MTVVRPIWEALIDGAKYCEPQLRAIVDRVKPDVTIIDNVLTFPAMVTAGVPYVRIVSCNPLEVEPCDRIPPLLGGLAMDRAEEWPAFRESYRRTHRELWENYNEWVQSQGTRPLPDMEFIHSGALNLYVYPEELDYTKERPLDSTWQRLDSSVRQTEQEAPQLPDSFTDGSLPLVYFSLGSLGSADVALMRRVIDALAGVPMNIIVSKGPLGEEIELASNMWGADFLSQTTILPLVDLVITHGGNNTVTEAMHFGKPMILLPLFWDQHDNAQRVSECGFGRRLSTYGFTAPELRRAAEELLADTDLRQRLRGIGESIRKRDGLGRAATLLERIAS